MARVRFGQWEENRAEGEMMRSLKYTRFETSGRRISLASHDVVVLSLFYTLERRGFCDLLFFKFDLKIICGFYFLKLNPRRIAWENWNV